MSSAGRSGTRIFGLFPRRHHFRDEKNVLLWGANPHGSVIAKAAPETVRTDRQTDEHSSAQSPGRFRRLENRSMGWGKWTRMSIGFQGDENGSLSLLLGVGNGPGRSDRMWTGTLSFLPYSPF